jgi:hypothetical protein
VWGRRRVYLPAMADFFEQQAKSLYGLGELETEALEVLRLIVRQTERGRTWTAIIRAGESRCRALRQSDDARSKRPE